MKQIFTILVALLATTNLWAYDFQYGELYYNITSSSEPYTVEVTYQELYSPSNYSGLTSVTIPETVTYDGTTYSVTSIGSQAFYYCSSLTSMVVESGNNTYDSRENCNAIIETATNTLIAGCQNTIIPNSVTSIGYGAFWGCDSLTSITIPNSVTSIGGDAFLDCSSLSSIVVESGNSTYDSRENCNAIIETATNTLIAGCQNTTIPNSVTSIGSRAFGGCHSLTSIAIPNSVTSIGWSAFSDCSSLTSVTIPNSVTSIGDGAFSGCSSLTSVTIPNSVTSIGDSAFSGCDSLTSITIPNSVTSIGDWAFSGCSSLTSITIPNSVTSIGSRAFGDCHSLTSIAIPNSVTSIGESAFSHCSSLTSVTIPNSVTSIGDWAFGSCDDLISIVVESGNSTYDSRENCNAIIETATNTLIAGCQNTTIPNSVTSIGSRAFERCSALTSIAIPNSVTSIGNNAFAHCYALTSITIPNSVTSIVDGAFSYCGSLTSVTIPNSVTSIGDEAFYGCWSLKTVICEAIEVPELGNNVFYAMPLSEATLYVPAESLDDYKAAEQWKEFGTILPIEETSTGVEKTYNPSSTADINKLIRDGQVIIVRGGKSYSVMGQELY